MRAALAAVAWLALIGAALTESSPFASASPAPLATPRAASNADDPVAPRPTWHHRFHVHLSSNSPRAGDTLNVVVLTSSNVASVEIRIASFGANLPKTDVGHFEGGNPVPNIPFFMSHNFTLDVIARNTAGAWVKQSLPFQIR
jgi:hypothetical protein